jgi:hypothetical protein
MLNSVMGGGKAALKEHFDISPPGGRAVDHEDIPESSLHQSLRT